MDYVPDSSAGRLFGGRRLLNSPWKCRLGRTRDGPPNLLFSNARVELQDRVMKKFFHSLCVRFARKLDTHQRVDIFVNED